MCIKNVFYVQALKSKIDTGNEQLKSILQFKDFVKRKNIGIQYSNRIKRLDQ